MYLARKDGDSKEGWGQEIIFTGAVLASASAQLMNMNLV